MRLAPILAIALVAGFVLPGAAQPNGTVPLDLTFSTNKGGDGTISGTFGGIPVTGTFTGDDTSGTWVLMVDGQIFASGTYTCGDGGCVFEAAMLMGRPVNFTIPTTGLNSTVSGRLSGLFRNHGQWVSSVAKWSNTNLAPGRVGKIVSGAAKIQAGAMAQSGGHGLKIQGAKEAKAGKSGGRIESRGQGHTGRAGANPRVAQHDKKDREPGRGSGQGSGVGNNGGNGNGAGQGNGTNGNGGGNVHGGGNSDEGGNGRR